MKIKSTQPNYYIPTKPVPVSNPVSRPVSFGCDDTSVLKNNALTELKTQSDLKKSALKKQNTEYFFKQIETNPDFQEFKTILDKDPSIKNSILPKIDENLTPDKLKNNLSVFNRVKTDFPEMYKKLSNPSKKSMGDLMLQFLTDMALSEKDYISLIDNKLVVNLEEPFLFLLEWSRPELKGRDLENNIKFLSDLKKHKEIGEYFRDENFLYYVRDFLNRDIHDPINLDEKKEVKEVLKLFGDKGNELLGMDGKIGMFFRNDISVDAAEKFLKWIDQNKYTDMSVKHVLQKESFEDVLKVLYAFKPVENIGSYPFSLMKTFGAVQTKNLVDTINYAFSKKVLKDCSVFDDLLKYARRNNDKEFDFRLDVLKPQIDELCEFYKMGGEELFELDNIGDKCFADILKGKHETGQFNLEATKFVRSLLEDENLKPLVMENEKDVLKCIKDKTLKQEYFENNLEVIKKLFKKGRVPEFLRDYKTIFFQGYLDELLQKYYELEALGVNFKCSIDENWNVHFKNINNNSEKVFDNNLVPVFIEKSEHNWKHGILQDVTKIRDFNHNIDYEFKENLSEISDNTMVLDELTKTTKDTSGNIVSKEVVKPSAVDGVFDIQKTDSSGNIQKISEASKTDGGIKIKKRLSGLDGEMTYFDYLQNSSKTYEKFDYVIKDKNGRILAEKHSVMRQTGENSYTNIVNGIKYDITHQKDGIIRVFNHFSGKETFLNIKITGEFQDEIRGLLKTLWGPELEGYNNSIHSIKYVPNLDSSINQWSGSLNTSIDFASLAHEAGHGKGVGEDFFTMCTFDNYFAKNPEFQKIYNQEVLQLKNELPPKFANSIDYFIEPFKSKSKTIGQHVTYSSPLSEAVAEINVILNTPFFNKFLALRTHFLQQYFPKTIAFVMRHHLLV